MNDFPDTQQIEAERYELREGAAYRFHFTRRSFFKHLGGGLVVFLLLGKIQAQESGGARRRGGRGGGNLPQEIGAWLHIAEDGKITAYSGKAEVGQNVRTALAVILAEELRVAPEKIQMVMADTALCPWDAGTFGSRSMPDMGRQMRRVGAAAREALLDLAAEKWSVDRASLVVADGKVSSNGSKSADFGELTKGQKLSKIIAENPPVTPADSWKIAGHPHLKANGAIYVTGAHKYASDIQLPGMLHAKLLRPASYGASLISCDSSAAEKLPGVSVVKEGNFIAVTARNDFEARKALESIKAEWKSSEQISDPQLFDHLVKDRPIEQPPQVKDALEKADVRLNERYTIAYIAHAPLEPRAAVANFEDGKITVWTGTQRPFGVRSEVAEALKIPESQVHVIVPDTGSGYGGKHTGEAAVEAARISMQLKKPVKLVWSRAEEFTWAYFRPAGVIQVSSGASKEGALAAWDFHNFNSGGSAIGTLYDVPHKNTQFHSSPSPLRQGSYRGLAATANHFARESHMDELAQAVKMDPLEFRLKNLKDSRLRAVLEKAAKEFGWGKKAEPNHGFGIAGGFEKGGYIATCAEVRVDGKEVKIVRAVSVFECGAVVNPEQLKNQIEGALVMGLGGALREEIKFANGKITNPKFSAYKVPRFSDTPEVKVYLIDRKDLPSSGAGETPIVCIAPAVANAIFAACGKRIRSLPMVPNGLPV